MQDTMTANPPFTTMTLSRVATMQQEHEAWELGNFGKQEPWTPLIGMWEETGELARCYLKIEQGIRGSVEEHKIAAKDAVGDIMVFLVSYCTKMGLKLADVIAHGFDESEAYSHLWQQHHGVFAVSRAYHKLEEAHIERHGIEEVKKRVYELCSALYVFSHAFLDRATAFDCLFFAWAEVKERKWKVNPWDGKTDTTTNTIVLDPTLDPRGDEELPTEPIAKTCASEPAKACTSPDPRCGGPRGVSDEERKRLIEEHGEDPHNPGYPKGFGCGSHD